MTADSRDQTLTEARFAPGVVEFILLPPEGKLSVLDEVLDATYGRPELSPFASTLLRSAKLTCLRSGAGDTEKTGETIRALCPPDDLDTFTTAFGRCVALIERLCVDAMGA